MLTETVLSVSPGPAVMLVVATGLAMGVRRSFFANLGILTSNALSIALSALGVGAVLLASGWLYELLRLVGVAYLVYLGALAILGHPSPVTISAPPSVKRGPFSAFLAGFVLQVGNPKAILFFVAILPQFLVPTEPVLPQILWLTAGSVIPELFILLLYGWLASKARVWATDPRYVRWSDRVAGGLLWVAALLVLTVATPAAE